ncbi:MAG: rhamnulokinase [Solirubrobacteraceae bacterium]
MAESLRLAAVDLGAESGRVVLGCFDGDTVSLDVCHRFANRPLWLPDGLHWNLPGLFAQALAGLAAAADGGPLDGIGIDAWGCDYALLDSEHRMLGLPFSYRDERTSVDNMARAHARVAREELYARTGIQTMPINTSYQLATEAGGAAARVAEHIALVPDLLGLWLTGTLANELTIASTTGLLEARGRRWAVDLVKRLGLPADPFGGEAVAPGFALGAVLERHGDDAGAAVGAPVRTVGGHDTASAFAAAPLAGNRCAVLSSGTWSLLGVELPEPQLGADAAAFNLTNERGVSDTVRLLRNVMGLWLVQECRRVWRAKGSDRDYDELQSLAGEAPSDVSVFDPDDDCLLHGGDMPARITALCTGSGQTAPSGDGELLRSILTSLACKYRVVCEQLEHVSEHGIDTIHVVGGGARNELLCQLTADVCGREVIAGPVEATALGNVLVQALAIGELAGLGDVRRVAARSVAPRRYEPRPSSPGTETYQRFLETTGLSATRAARAPV